MADAGEDTHAMSLAEARLAALGEAFMDSIDQVNDSPPKRHKSSYDSTSPGISVTKDVASNKGSSGKRQKNKRRHAALFEDVSKVSEAGSVTGGVASPSSKALVTLPTAQRNSPPPAKALRREDARPTRGQHAGPPVTAAERRRFMSGNISDILSKKPSGEPTPARKKRRVNDDDPEEDPEFKKTVKDVLNFVIPQLGKREQKQWEEARLRALGGTLEKRQKMPYSCLKRAQKRAEEKRQEKLKEEAQMEVSTSIHKHRNGFLADTHRRKKKEGLKEMQKRRDDFALTRLGMGARENRGLVTIPSRSVRNFKYKMGRK